MATTQKQRFYLFDDGREVAAGDADAIAAATRLLAANNKPPTRSCNRHTDCDAANEKAKAAGRLGAEHCHDECCEECFGY